MDINYNNGTKRVSYILKIQVNDKYHVFNRHSETDYLNKYEIEYFYDEVPMAYFEDAGIEILEVVDVPNYSCGDQHYLDQKKEYWNKKLGITSTYIDEDKEYHKLCRMQMRILKDKYKEMKKLKIDTINDLCNTRKSFDLLIKLQELYYEYYVKDVRYQHCNRIKYFSSVRLSTKEQWLFVLFKGFFNSFNGAFNVCPKLRKFLYDYLAYGKDSVDADMTDYEPVKLYELMKKGIFGVD